MRNIYVSQLSVVTECSSLNSLKMLTILNLYAPLLMIEKLFSLKMSSSSVSRGERANLGTDDRWRIASIGYLRYLVDPQNLKNRLIIF